MCKILKNFDYILFLFILSIIKSNIKKSFFLLYFAKEIKYI